MRRCWFWQRWKHERQRADDRYMFMVRMAEASTYDHEKRQVVLTAIECYKAAIPHWNCECALRSLAEPAKEREK